jgi:hypothetical protein
MLEVFAALAIVGFIQFCRKWNWKWMMWKGQERHVYYPHKKNDIDG